MHLEIVKIALGNLNQIASRMSKFLNVLLLLIDYSLVPKQKQLNIFRYIRKKFLPNL